MIDLKAIQEAANAEAEVNADMNVAVKGGSAARLLPKGTAFAQLVEYIDLGNHVKEFAGVAKPAAPEFQLGFALTGKGYENEDGTPFIIRPYSMTRSLNDKSTSFKVFKAMNFKGTARHFGQLIGEKWMVKVVHVPKSKSDPTLVSRLDITSFMPPVDPVTGDMYKIKDAPESAYKVFFWNNPTMNDWNSLFIEGTYEAKDGKPEASKNRIQEKILSATNFQGSALELLLSSGGV